MRGGARIAACGRVDVAGRASGRVGAAEGGEELAQAEACGTGLRGWGMLLPKGSVRGSKQEPQTLVRAIVVKYWARSR